MKNINNWQAYLLVLTIFCISCKSITITKICTSTVTLPNDYINAREILPLAKDNFTGHNSLDTFYLKREKETGKLFGIEDNINIDIYNNHPIYKIEKYIYLHGTNQTEIAWKNTIVEYLINKTKYPVDVVCPDQLSQKSKVLIQESLMSLGYLNDLKNNPDYEFDIKPALIAFQKDNNLGYGKLDLLSLKKLGIKVKIDTNSN